MNQEKGSILLLDPAAVTEHDIEIIQALDQYPPQTEYQPGDLFYVRERPSYMNVKYRDPLEMPQMWKVRFVISKWAWYLMSIIETQGTDFVKGPDHAVALVDRAKLKNIHYYDPVIYAHAYPHGTNPDSAAWFEERDSKGRVIMERVYFREVLPAWPVILDEARAQYFPIDPGVSRAPFMWNQAPDLYQDGENIGKPFRHEDATVDAICMNPQLERVLFDRKARKDRLLLDPEHDIFRK